MPVSRRKFLQSSALAAIGCAANPLSAESGRNHEAPTNGVGPSAAMNAAPGRQSFVNVVGSSFEVTSKTLSQPVWLRLLAVSDLPALAPVNTASMAVPPPKHSKTRTTTGFVLSLGGGPVPNLSQGTYTFRNSSLGEFPLFIVPGGAQSYSAIFNHL